MIYVHSFFCFSTPPKDLLNNLNNSFLLKNIYIYHIYITYINTILMFLG